MDLIPALILTVSALVFVVFTGLTFVELKDAVADKEPDTVWVNLFLGVLSVIAGGFVAGLLAGILFAGRLIVGRIVESTAIDTNWAIVGWAVVVSFVIGFALNRK